MFHCGTAAWSAPYRKRSPPRASSSAPRARITITTGTVSLNGSAPERQYVIMLRGEVEIEASDGTVRRLGAGDILLAEDTTGKGHCSRSVGRETRQSVFVTLD